MLQDLLSKFSTPAEKQGYLLQLTAAHPYFAPAQFCLLQTLQPAEADYGRRAAIAHLLYNNAHWLQFQLAQNASPQMVALPSTPTADLAQVDNIDETDTITAAPETSPAINGHDEHPVLQHANEDIPLTVEAAHTAAETVEIPTVETAAPTAEAILSGKGDGTAETPISDLAEPVENDPVATSSPEKEEMLFEPLFAVDYFASQGIKLSEEVQPSDKLGQQLKSFTEWLKSMKKTNSPSLPDTELDSDADVQTIAEKSNTEGDVVTEAMAEVFALQGRKQKALAIYHKLSLLNPHKSAYFAAKIENLK